jgi:hypothetical protein
MREIDMKATDQPTIKARNETGGYENIYRNLLEDLKAINLAGAAKVLGLSCNQSGQIEIPFLGDIYNLDTSGARNNEGQEASTVVGSVLAGYVITQGRGEPSNRFVPMDKLTEMVSSGNNYSNTSLEARLAKYAGKDPARFEEAVVALGGKPGGEVGSGGKSWIVHLLPQIPVQLIFYEGDNEFPAVVHLLFDLTSVNFLEFEFLAVLATIFVHEVVRLSKPHSVAA